MPRLSRLVTASRTLDAPPLLVDLSDTSARSELEGRYGLRLRAVLYVPIVSASTSPNEETSVNQIGVIEMVVVERGALRDERSPPLLSTPGEPLPLIDTSVGRSPSAKPSSAHALPAHALPAVLLSAPNLKVGVGSDRVAGLRDLRPGEQLPLSPRELRSTAAEEVDGGSFRSKDGGSFRSKGSAAPSGGGRSKGEESFSANPHFSPIATRQLGQLGGYLAVALQSLRLSDEDLQGERLLYRMLPKHIVTQLQKRVPEDFIVESCEHAFVLFSDIVSFTAYCARREPRDVVVMLNSMFATFDALLSKHRVHKVTTIGDAYVAATGLPFMDSASPSMDIVSFALDMIAAVRTFVTEDGERMQIRIGIHAGPVAAGVVGIAMPRYCLFGETVTIAEQLEERSRAGSILISQSVYDSLQTLQQQQAISHSLTYEPLPEPLTLLGSSAATSAYFLNARAHRRRQESLAYLEEMATAQLSYFKGRTTSDASRLGLGPGKEDASSSSRKPSQTEKDSSSAKPAHGNLAASSANSAPLQRRMGSALSGGVVFRSHRQSRPRHLSDSDLNTAVAGEEAGRACASAPLQRVSGLRITPPSAFRARRNSSPHLASDSLAAAAAAAAASFSSGAAPLSLSSGGGRVTSTLGASGQAAVAASPLSAIGTPGGQLDESPPPPAVRGTRSPSPSAFKSAQSPPQPPPQPSPPPVVVPANDISAQGAPPVRPAAPMEVESLFEEAGGEDFVSRPRQHSAMRPG